MRTAVGTLSQGRSIAPETVNQWTHAAGFAASVPAGAVMLSCAARSGGDGWTVAACAVYCFALSALYAASALSHGFESRPRLRAAFRATDQACIYLLIAGSFTPFAVAHARTPFGLAQLAAMWLLAAVGIVLRVRRRGDLIGMSDLAFCLATGWIPLLSLGGLIAVGGPDGFALVLAGAACYTGGTVFLMNDHRHPYLHGVWHLATLGGSGCHYLFLLNHVAAA